MDLDVHAPLPIFSCFFLSKFVCIISTVKQEKSDWISGMIWIIMDEFTKGEKQ